MSYDRLTNKAAIVSGFAAPDPLDKVARARRHGYSVFKNAKGGFQFVQPDGHVDSEEFDTDADAWEQAGGDSGLWEDDHGSPKSAAYCHGCNLANDGDHTDDCPEVGPVDPAPLLDDRETATVLAALRWWQKSSVMDGAVLDIATDGGRFHPLGDAEIDDLCERINV